jgi:hypothetical protein
MSAALLGNYVIYRIKKINTVGERKIYDPLTKLSLGTISPWYGVNHCIYVCHMIDKLFIANVTLTENSKAFVEYTKRWIKIWYNSLETEEEYISTRTSWPSWTVIWTRKVLVMITSRF